MCNPIAEAADTMRRPTPTDTLCKTPANAKVHDGSEPCAATKDQEDIYEHNLMSKEVEGKQTLDALVTHKRFEYDLVLVRASFA